MNTAPAFALFPNFETTDEISSFFTRSDPSDSPTNLSTAASNFTSPLPTATPMSIRVANIIVGVVGVIGNLQASVVMFAYKPMRRRLANYYLANQCIIDLVLSVIVTLMYTGDSAVVTGIAGELVCRLWKNRSIFLGFFASSLFSVVALTIDRYVEIVYPIQHKLRLTRKFVIYSLVVINFAGVAFKLSFTVPMSDVIGNVCLSGIYPSNAVKMMLGVLNFMVEFFIPLSIIAFCYVGMARSLHRKVLPISGAGMKTWNNARKNIVKTLLFVVIVFIICTTFKQILTLLFFLNVYNPGVGDMLFSVATLMAYSNCCFNPLVYFFKYEEFKKGLRWFYGCPTVKPKFSRSTTEKDTQTQATARC